jgi:hypothetical protein
MAFSSFVVHRAVRLVGAGKWFPTLPELLASQPLTAARSLLSHYLECKPLSQHVMRLFAVSFTPNPSQLLAVSLQMPRGNARKPTARAIPNSAALRGARARLCVSGFPSNLDSAGRFGLLRSGHEHLSGFYAYRALRCAAAEGSRVSPQPLHLHRQHGTAVTCSSLNRLRSLVFLFVSHSFASVFRRTRPARAAVQRGKLARRVCALGGGGCGGAVCGR